MEKAGAMLRSWLHSLAILIGYVFYLFIVVQGLQSVWYGHVRPAVTVMASPLIGWEGFNE